MASTASSSTKVRKPEYEFGGPVGAFGIVFGLPLLLWTFAFACNDISGCPAPSLLSPATLTLEKLKAEVGWPKDGIYGLCSWKAFGFMMAYYALNVFLYAIMPAQYVDGTVLVGSGKRLKYKMNSFNSSAFTLVLAAAGTIAQGAEFSLWTFLTENYIQLLTANIIISFILAIYLYVNSFSVKPNDPTLRELAAGGHTGNLMYDFYIGRELNPRVTLPFVGEIDLKEFCELRPGMLLWILYNCAWIAKQYRNYGYVSDSILLVAAVQSYYSLDGMYYEPSVLTMMDLTTDGFGYMLAFGDLVWVPFLYTHQTRYLSTHPVQLGYLGLGAIFAVLATGFTIFRLSNSEKNIFRTDPNDPRVAHLSYIQTKTGTRLLTSGWWGVARHINYFGDWIQGWPYSLPTGFAGYAILSAGSAVPGTLKMLDGREVLHDGPAKYWGIIFTYFYVLYFGVLLIHRDGRDERKCALKYGDDWKKYESIVKYRIVPFVY